ncbi:hypothetical protein [Inhella sp.]|uniref:hypothetical protein n=1 Tax=Inhella sp. TaxID=1921806 RepID=UPI0035B4083F
MMKTLKWLAGGLLALFLLCALVLGAWVLSNVRDAEPPSWPPELRVGPNRLAEADNLHHALLVPKALARSFNLRMCEPDCSTAWRRELPAWRNQAGAAEFFAACEALDQRPRLQYEEPLPTRVTPSADLPPYQLLVSCSNHLLLQAFEHADAGRDALPWLQQADRLGRAVQQGARTLIGQMIATALAGNQLLVLREIGQLRPELGPELATLAQASEQDWRAGMLRWIGAQAEFGRNLIEDMATQAPCAESEGMPLGLWARLTCPLQGLGWQPNYQQQLAITLWGRLRTLAQQHPLETLPAAVRAATPAETGWTWFHTIPHVMWAVAQPAWTGYFERTADLLLSSQATVLWLQAQAQPAATRADWARAQLQGELARRLTITPEGGWSLQTWRSQGAKDMPVHWPATRS